MPALVADINPHIKPFTELYYSLKDLGDIFDGLEGGYI
jgi:hypothetical protein